VKFQVIVQRVDDDQGGYWEAWAHRMNAAGGIVEHVPGATSSGCDLRDATHECFEAVIRYGEQSDIDRLRRRNAELEQLVAEWGTAAWGDPDSTPKRYHLEPHIYIDGLCACGAIESKLHTPPAAGGWQWRCSCGSTGSRTWPDEKGARAAGYGHSRHPHTIPSPSGHQVEIVAPGTIELEHGAYQSDQQT
jgi:hypothetical protein